MFVTVTWALGNFDAMSYSAPIGEKRVAIAPEKLEPESRSAEYVSGQLSYLLHTGHGVAEHNRVLVHLLRRNLDGVELALPAMSALSQYVGGAIVDPPVIKLGVRRLCICQRLCRPSDDSLLDMPMRLPRLWGVLGSVSRGQQSPPLSGEMKLTAEGLW